MIKKKRYFLILVCFGLALLGVFIFWQRMPVHQARAGAGDNVWGWAWSENIGWISLNRTNCDADDNGFSDGVPAGCPVAGWPIPAYGVNIDASGVFSGFAWSENIGAIDFSPIGWPAAPLHGAQADVNTGEVTGWARACAVFQNNCILPLKDNSERGGWDGWIKFSGTNYQVTISNVSQEFEGWAWGEEVIGWISFNCNNPESGDVCATRNYKAETTFDINDPPEANNLTVTAQNYCITPIQFFDWEFSDPEDGALQTSYRLQVRNDDLSSNWGGLVSW